MLIRPSSSFIARFAVVALLTWQVKIPASLSVARISVKLELRSPKLLSPVVPLLRLRVRLRSPESLGSSETKESVRTKAEVVPTLPFITTPPPLFPVNHRT